MSRKTVQKLEYIRSLIDQMLESLEQGQGSKRSHRVKRRTSAEAAEFREFLKKERDEGVPVAQLSRKQMVTASYIYQIK